MPYPLGDEHVVEVPLPDIVPAPLAELQRLAGRHRHPSLMLIRWDIPAEESSRLYDDIATFQRWAWDQPRRRRDDFYLLHFLPTDDQQQRLDAHLVACECLAGAWSGDGMRPLGAFTHPIHEELLAFIASHPNLTTDQIAEQLPGQYGQDYIRNELSKLVRGRAVARTKRLPIPQVLGISKNRWHLWPLWRPEGSTSQSDNGTAVGCQEGRNGSNHISGQARSTSAR